MSAPELARYEEARGRATCAGLRLALLVSGMVALMPAGIWLLLEATGFPQWGGGLLCTVAGVLASAIPEEKARAERLTREAARLKCQVMAEEEVQARYRARLVERQRWLSRQKPVIDPEWRARYERKLTDRERRMRYQALWREKRKEEL